MSLDPLVLVAEVDRATERLLRTASALDGDPAGADLTVSPPGEPPTPPDWI